MITLYADLASTGWSVYQVPAGGDLLWVADWSGTDLTRGPGERLYATEEIATQVAIVWATVIACRRRVDEAIGDEWPYNSKPGHALADPAVAVYTRAMYETACAAVELAPLSDADCDVYGVHHGDFGPPEYGAVDMVEVTLARRRLAGIRIEAQQRDQQGLAAATAAAGAGPYSREQYETACTALGVTARSEVEACALWEQYLDQHSVVGDPVGDSAGTPAEVTLAGRRAAGMLAETPREPVHPLPPLAGPRHRDEHCQRHLLPRLLRPPLRSGSFAMTTANTGDERQTLESAWTLFSDRMAEHAAGHTGGWPKEFICLGEADLDLGDDRLRILAAEGRRVGVIVAVTDS